MALSMFGKRRQAGVALWHAAVSSCCCSARGLPSTRLASRAGSPTRISGVIEAAAHDRRRAALFCRASCHRLRAFGARPPSRQAPGAAARSRCCCCGAFAARSLLAGLVLLDVRLGRGRRSWSYFALQPAAAASIYGRTPIARSSPSRPSKRAKTAWSTCSSGYGVTKRERQIVREDLPRQDEQADRRRAIHQPADRQGPHPPHLLEARRQQPDAARADDERGEVGVNASEFRRRRSASRRGRSPRPARRAMRHIPRSVRPYRLCRRPLPLPCGAPGRSSRTRRTACR